MVFGLFEGGIELRLNKTNFAFGETAEGTLSLKLKKEKQARHLVVSVIAEKQETQYRKGTSFTMSSSNNTCILFKTDAILDGEKTYMPPGGEYQFKIQIPAQAALPQELGGTLGTALKAMQFLGGKTSQIKWFIAGTLDIPKGIDISKKVQISVQ